MSISDSEIHALFSAQKRNDIDFIINQIKSASDEDKKAILKKMGLNKP